MAVTLVDIARIANVSESAVSRALHDHPRISVATRERIKKIAAELDFEHNSHARSLSTQKSGTIGIILPNFGTDVRRTYYLDLLISDLRNELAKTGLDLLIADSSQGGQASNLRRLVLQHKVDALVLIIADLHEADRNVLRKNKVPVVMVNSKPLELVDKSVDEFASFFTDNLRGGRLAAEHLVERGCRRLVCLADEIAGPEMVDRTLGFAQAATERGCVPRVLSTASDFDSTFQFVLANRDLFASVDGVFCHTDVMACAVLRALQEQGRSVPQQVRVVGYDDIELGTYFSPRLTTIHQPREEIARQACAQLALLMSGQASGPVQHVSVAPSLVAREST